jgi:predicted GH43/DUF377 family glycosyl hydrolase
VWWRKQREQDLEREIRAHLELEAEEQREAGVKPEEARYAARRAFGNVTLLMEVTRVGGLASGSGYSLAVRIAVAADIFEGMRTCGGFLVLSMLTGCGRYADFTLPLLPGGAPPSWQWSAREAPVLKPGDWDSRDVLNPSVVRRESLYYNFYSGYDGKTWHTGLATSPDGFAWSKQGRVLSPDPRTWEGNYIAANGSALWASGEFLYWYQAGPKDAPAIALARSTDGLVWRKLPAAVVGHGPRGSWDERATADPYVIRLDDGWFYMYYLGQDRARRQRIGVARSRDGVAWEKSRGNPILELGESGAFDEEGLGEPAVWNFGGSYWMLYTGRNRAEQRRMGLARSRDGVSWERTALVISGQAAWDSQVVCDPTVEVEADGVRVWFGGGDRASPDENLDGQIGVGILHPVGATLAR